LRLSGTPSFRAQARHRAIRRNSQGIRPNLKGFPHNPKGFRPGPLCFPGNLKGFCCKTKDFCNRSTGWCDKAKGLATKQDAFVMEQRAFVTKAFSVAAFNGAKPPLVLTMIIAILLSVKTMATFAPTHSTSNTQRPIFGRRTNSGHLMLAVRCFPFSFRGSTRESFQGIPTLNKK
jgi:hypothetical protein